MVRMRTLGISAYARGAAAALVEDGVPLAAAAEERFSRRRGDDAFPLRAARFCLAEAGVTARELDAVVFHEKPLRRFEHALASELAAFPRSAGRLADGAFRWLGERLWVKAKIASELEVDARKVLFVAHHDAQAAAAFFASPFDEAAVVVAGGAGEWASASLALGSGTSLEPLAEIHEPDSLDLFAAGVRRWAGLAPDWGPGAIADLATAGEPRFAESLRELLRVRDDGSFELVPERARLDPVRGLDGELARRLGPAHRPGAGSPDADAARRDAAASLHLVLEEALLALARAAHARTKSERLCLNGSLAQDPSALARLAAEGPFRALFVPPAAGEPGAALGAALFVQHAVHGLPRARDAEQVFLGEGILHEAAPGARHLGDDEAPAGLARRLEAGMVLGLARGRFEWSERGLGHRSLLAAPGAAGALRKVSRAESFRSLVCSVPADRAAELFELPAAGEGLARFARIAARPRERELFAHAANAAGRLRVHAVELSADPLLHRLLAEIGARSGTPALLHASLCLRGEPLARGASDALGVFERSELGALWIEDALYERA